MAYSTKAVGAMRYMVLSSITLMVAVFVVWQFAAMLDRPEVRVSAMTHECVEVIDHKANAEGKQSEWSCKKLPDRYDRVWVF